MEPENKDRKRSKPSPTTDKALAREALRQRLRRYKLLPPSDVEVRGPAEYQIKRVPRLTRHTAEHFDGVIGGLTRDKG